VQKLIRTHAVGPDDPDSLEPGAFVRLRPRRIMSHDNTGAIIPKFEGLFAGSTRQPAILDPSQPVFALDHNIQDLTPENLGKYARIRAFAGRHGVVCYGAGTGIGHQLMLERGHVTPGSVCAASDSHANAYGALGALGVPIVRTDAAVAWATGEFWWRVPPVIRVELVGTLREGVSGKDVIVTLCDRFRRDALNAAVEFGGPGLRSMWIADRMAIANMTTEWGATACVMEADGAVVQYLRDRADYGEFDAPIPDRIALTERCLRPDAGAMYAAVIRVDLSTVSPAVTGPNTVSRATPCAKLARHRIRIDKAYLVSCVNARVEDIRIAADIVRGRRVAPHVEFYIAAASQEVQRIATQRGDWQTLVDAGAIELPPGCGPCIGLGAGTVREGETAISATNRNYPGRMGDRGGTVYLGSPAVVAASAVAGYITVPGNGFDPIEVDATITRVPARAPRRPSESRAGSAVTGRAILIPEEDVSTDQVFAGTWTYRDGLTRAEMARVAFENLDPGLAARIRPGDIVLAGANFGTGSSREQAVTALQAAGIAAIVCESASETYQRNAINNGMVCVECPGLGRIASALSRGGERIGPELSLDVVAGTVTIGARTLRFVPVDPFIREVVDAGGVETLTTRRLGAAPAPVDSSSFSTGCTAAHHEITT